MIIRHATLNDLKRIADVHFKCFPNSFSTQLGKANSGVLQQKFYQEYIKDVPELFFVAEDETLPPPERVIGFCMGYYSEKNEYMKNFLLHNSLLIALRMSILLFSGSKVAWKKVLGRFKKKDIFSVVNDDMTFLAEEIGDLLSICVLSNYRGCGIAQQLIEKFEEELRKKNRKICLLTVATNNGRGIRFYEKNGFVPYKEAVGVARTYAKIL